MLGSSGRDRGEAQQKNVCVFMHTCAHRCSPAGEEGREGRSQPGEERLEVAQVDGRSGVSVAHLLLFHLLYLQYNTFIPRVAVSSAGVGESRETQSHRAALGSATRVSPLQVRGLDDHLAPGYHLGLLSQGTMGGGQALACPMKSNPSSALKLPGPIRGTQSQGSTALYPRLRGLTQPPPSPQEVLLDPR